MFYFIILSQFFTSAVGQSKNIRQINLINQSILAIYSCLSSLQQLRPICSLNYRVVLPILILHLPLFLNASTQMMANSLIFYRSNSKSSCKNLYHLVFDSWIFTFSYFLMLLFLVKLVFSYKVLLIVYFFQKVSILINIMNLLLLLILQKLQIYCMSLSRNQSFFKQYAKSGYLDKINPQFDGIAKKYYNQKKEHQKVHSIKAKLDKEVAFMERLQKKMQVKLQKKQVELKYTKQVSSRFQNDLRRREWIQEYHSKQVKNNQQKANLIKSQSTQRIKQAQQYLIEHKKSLANLNRSQNQKIKQARQMKKAKQWDNNRSRVSQIYQFKKDVKESCNKFYQSRTGSSLKKYNQKIETFKEYKENDKESIKSLEQRLTELSKNKNSKQQKAKELSKQIAKMKQQAKIQNGLIRSRLRSQSSMSSISNRSKKQGEQFQMRKSQMKPTENK